MAFYIVQFLTGLASAASLFLVASGLSIIFGVTRIVNFAHGAFYMLGAYVAYTLTEQFSGAFGFWSSILLAALIVAAIGVAVEMLLLRRIYHAPELFQLLATFGLTLMVEDLVVLSWGPDDLVGPRAPGLKGAIDFFGQRIPSYDLFLIALGPVVLGLLWLVFQRTRWGVLVRAATQDRDMVAALGVNQKWLFTSVFALGVFLAALAGALQIPRDAVNHAMDLRVIVDVFVVVVIGGLGSVVGAFVAAVLVSELNAFGILIFPKISIILVFLVMAVVLIVRPWGLLGKAEAPARRTPGLTVNPWRALTSNERIAAAIALLFAASLPFFAGNYALTVGAEIAIFVIFAASLHFLMSAGGLASFGHAAYFGLGAYGVAFAVKLAGLPMLVALLAGPLFGLLGAAVFGFFSVQLSGVYFAMLTLAFAQIVWSIAFQWVGVTGGDNGILGVWPERWASSPSHFYWLSLAVAALAVGALRIVTFSPFGFALRANRDSPLRSEAIGIDGKRIQWSAFVIAGTVAGIGGALFAYLKGSVFPDVLGIPLSVDALVMVLLGGVETVSGAIIGAIVYKTLSIWLVSQTDWSKLVLGAFIVVIVIAFPKGIVGTFEAIWPRRLSPAKPTAIASPIETAE
ncbi:ABC transporter permease [Bradyrhizobium erythrophlei]|uniref:Amino acid/amide ABC transporter membrane protein 1, HAAT family /amino acid/amide ABC transporter membrane protein 2, HAAT family n=1 Tax=Bradyrhizobium erythrophlei TaxID=1437360 RepID=A0A1M7T1Q9_9BRAD|nr:ABC transporter permease [Bradyrhizobium erythrophlei]SHN64656.1 amino acid/amide ABC transporter membrane protein 1, HAAT family /amino acid/amide ABC transporter membrane protein 2, HAAT family [Bradyrhizobium erythrophlei]